VSEEPGAVHDFDEPLIAVEEVDGASEDDLWFLPGPMENEPDYLPPGPRAEPRETEVLNDWRKAEGGQAARLARVAGRIGALDDRLKRRPEGWRHRLALWISLPLSGVQDDTAALARVGWAVQRIDWQWTGPFLMRTRIPN
jgi:hypothetical protein